MSLSKILYQLFLSPLTLLFQGVYISAYTLLKSTGAALLPLSLVVNFLLLPFYNRADSIQEEERNREKSMEPYVSHIKKTFKGDERYMMLQAYYKTQNYKPIYALRSTLALVLEIPFFIAAYHFLSTLPDLNGAHFLFFHDLGKPDQLLKLGSFSINLLPVLMTLINIISSEIYTRGLKLKDKLQLHGMALIFLVLLYDSPSGLVIYWTLNNIFSLMKNLVNTAQNRRKTANIFCSVLGGLIVLYSLTLFKGPIVFRLIVIGTGLLFQIPLLLTLLKKTPEKASVKEEDPKNYNWLFFGGAFFLSVLMGLLIPSAVIRSSPSEFVLISSFHSPVRYIFYAFLTALGTFVVWTGLFFYLSGKKSKKYFTAVIWILALSGVINYMFFGKNLSSLTSDLKLEKGLAFPLLERVLNWGTIAVLAFLVIVIFVKKDQVLRFISPVLLVAVLGMSVYNIALIQSSLSSIKRVARQSFEEKASFTFSRNGQNVVVLMLDRSIASYIPYLFSENPQLQEQFDGFTWYPNTLSYGSRTLTGSPALFGGYDYTPERINQRDEQLLQDKQNEALLTMPILFSEAGYEVTVCDPPFAGYSWIPDLSIFDDYPQIHAYNTENGQFRPDTYSNGTLEELWTRNFFCYSLMKVTPLSLQAKIYQNGNYFAPGNTNTVFLQSETPSIAEISPGLLDSFVDAYYALHSLPEMTKVTEYEQDAFLMIGNSTSHNVILLSEPDYVPVASVDNTQFDLTHKDRFTVDGVSMKMENAYQMAHYQCNMAALIQLGNWFDYLREMDVYDNTRIIIVADHGWSLGQFDNMIFGNEAQNDSWYNPEDAMAYNPLLLVKDFNSEGFTVDDTFMTNADTPTLALQGIIPDPIHPFTGNPIFNPSAKEGPQRVMYTDNWSPENNLGTTFHSTMWFNFYNQNVLDKKNWEKEES